MDKITKILKEPLVHFLTIGAGLFLLFNVTNGGGGDNPKQIVVTPGQVKQMKAEFLRSWMRPPTNKEVEGLIQNHLRDEIYYREALAMALDKDDALIRRRMRQKLEFILEDITAQVDPTDEELISYMQENEVRYQAEAKISFQQIYLNLNERKDIAGDAARILEQLSSGISPQSLGDQTMLNAELVSASENEIEKTFGDSFVQQIIQLESGKWLGPIFSANGGHLILVTERRDRQTPQLKEVRATVERDWLADRRDELKEVTFHKLLEGYEVVMEGQEKSDYGPNTAVASTRTEVGE